MPGTWLPRALGDWAKKLPQAELQALTQEWLADARISQFPIGLRPRTWLVMGGRGAGKTRVGAAWINALARGLAPFADRGDRHLALGLIGQTFADAREVMIEGPSGIIACAGSERPRYEATRRRVVWPSGAVAQVFSAEEPDSLRGPQFAAVWCDELAKWKAAEDAYDMLQFGLRLGCKPRQLITTTPRPLPLLTRILAEDDLLVTRMPTAENAENLAPGFLATVESRYRGQRLGRQELEGELIADREDALWSRERLERWVVDTAPERLKRIVVAVDPPASSGKNADACGIVAAGLDEEGRVIVLADKSRHGAKPLEWAKAAVELYRRLRADCIVAEVNQGGEMVSTIIRNHDPSVPVKPVRATRGKWLRAEPVAALYEQGRVRHARRFPELEDEMCDFGPDGLSDGRSPDRLDALVWAVTELALRERAEPRVRML